MSVFYPVTGAVEEPVFLRPDDTAVNDLIEFETTEEVSVIGLIVANEDSNAQLASIWVTIGAIDVLIFTASIGANTSAHDILPAPIKLQAKFGDRKIKVQAAAADVVTFTAIYSRTNANTNASG